MKKNLSRTRNRVITLLALLMSLLTSYGYSAFLETSYLSPTPVSTVNSVAWSPDGKYFATGMGSYASNGSVQIYSFNGSTLTPVGSPYNYGAKVTSIAWSNDGKFLAIGGGLPTDGNELQILSFNGTTLSLIQEYVYGASIRSISWSPNGNYLAIGGAYPTSGAELQIFSFNGTKLTFITDYPVNGVGNGDFITASVSWHPNGTLIAIGGYGAVSTGENVQVINFDGSTLTPLPGAQYHYGYGAHAVAWKPDGKWLAVGGEDPDDGYELQILAFNDTDLTLLPYAEYPYEATIYALTWSLSGEYLTFGGGLSGGSRFVIGYFCQTSLNTFHFDASFTEQINSFSWSPSGIYLAVGGGSSGPTKRLNIYTRYGALDGINNNYFFENQFLFRDGGIAAGNVEFKKGFSVDASQRLDLNICSPIDGPITLNNNPLINLLGDMHLASNASLNINISGFKLNGFGHTIFLGNNLSIATLNPVYINSDTIINGENNSLIIEDSQLYVDSGVTLTLRNLTLKTTSINPIEFPSIQLIDSTSKLALDNVTLSPNNDFYFNQGQLFIHNDVIFTGPSQFIYTSPAQSFITKNATFYFDHGTTFSYAPTSRNKDLLSLEDASSSLYLNGCTLYTTHTGLRLTKGRLFFDNNVTITSSMVESGIYPLIESSSTSDLPSCKSVTWNPDGDYLAACGGSSSNDINIFNFNGSTINNIVTATTTFGTGYYKSVQCAAWRPIDANVAFGGQDTTDLFMPNNTLKIYTFDGTNLTYNTGASLAGWEQSFPEVKSITWNSNGTSIAIGGYSTEPPLPVMLLDGYVAAQIRVYNFDGSNLSTITYPPSYGMFSGMPFGPYRSTVYSVAWHPSGSYLAAGGACPEFPLAHRTGTYPTDDNDIKIYHFSGSALSEHTSISLEAGMYPTTYSVAWDPTGNYLAATGLSTDELLVLVKIFSFDGTSLTLVSETVFSRLDGSGSTPPYQVTWTPDGKNILVGTSNVNDYPDLNYEMLTYRFDGVDLDFDENYSLNFGPDGSAVVHSITYSPDGKFFAIGGENPDPAHKEIEIYPFGSYISHQSLSNSLVFGNAALGPNYDLDVTVLGGANVSVTGMVNYDCAV